MRSNALARVVRSGAVVLLAACDSGSTKENQTESALGGGFGVGVTPDDHGAWIAIPGTGKVQVFNLQQRRISGSLNVGGDPRRLAFSAQGKIGAVTNTAGYLTFVK
jgi:DNA-binding beta-propeller fold protein YncE